jgi:hypothetical protein
MSDTDGTFPIEVEGMKAGCPLGEIVGREMIAAGRTAVISCERGCFMHCRGMSVPF